MNKLAIALVLLSACTKKVDQCTSNTDCTDPAFPFCDVDGSFPASGGDKNVCTIMPADCPIDVCGCTAGSATCGSDGTLAVCNADGMSVTTTMCSTGCELPAATCRTIVPSNGLGPVLASAAAEPAITIPSGATIDTDTGSVLDANLQSLTFATTLVTQPSGPTIRVFAGVTVTVGDVSISGSDAIAFVGDGPVTVGTLTAPAHGSTGGPGAVTSADCVGEAAVATGSDDVVSGFGAGGGGNATAGASGGGHQQPGATGGLATAGFLVLGGGCAGGGTTFPQSPDLGSNLGGGGGGAIQLVSNAHVNITGTINLGGGGGQQNSGGGAGGLLVVEAPTLSFTGQGGMVANGGGGGGGCVGADATPDTTAAPGGDASTGTGCGYTVLALAGGNGATEITPPQPGTITQSGAIVHEIFGGGGGAIGRARLATLDGTFASTGTTVLAVMVTSDVVVTQ